MKIILTQSFHQLIVKKSENLAAGGARRKIECSAERSKAFSVLGSPGGLKKAKIFKI